MDWWAYEPADLLMFSPETYARLFELTNQDLWPAQIVMLGAGLVILALTLRGPDWRGRAIAALLAAAWGLVAWGYFFERYAQINLAAPVFGWGFVAQAALFAGSAALGRLTFDAPRSLPANAGLILFIYALVLQPLTGALLGYPVAGLELFGIAPDPTALATLGLLLAADRIRWELFVIPVLWCAITGITLSTMNAPGAWLMPLAAVLVVGVALARRLRGSI